MAAYELDVAPQVSEIPRVIDWVAACCAQEGVAEETRFKLTLALEEAVMNVIGNAFSGLPPPHLIALRLDVTAELLAAEISDNGCPFDPRTRPDPDLDLPLEERRPGGLGIHLIRAMTDRLDYRRDGGRNILRLEKRRP